MLASSRTGTSHDPHGSFLSTRGKHKKIQISSFDGWNEFRPRLVARQGTRGKSFGRVPQGVRLATAAEERGVDEEQGFEEQQHQAVAHDAGDVDRVQRLPAPHLAERLGHRAASRALGLGAEPLLTGARRPLEGAARGPSLNSPLHFEPYAHPEEPATTYTAPSRWRVMGMTSA